VRSPFNIYRPSQSCIVLDNYSQFGMSDVEIVVAIAINTSFFDNDCLCAVALKWLLKLAEKEVRSVIAPIDPTHKSMTV
jgi:hypothetical protein